MHVCFLSAGEKKKKKKRKGGLILYLLMLCWSCHYSNHLKTGVKMIIFMIYGFYKSKTLLCSSDTVNTIQNIKMLSVFLRCVKVHLIVTMEQQKTDYQLYWLAVNMIKCQDSFEPNTDRYLKSVIKFMKYWK